MTVTLWELPAPSTALLSTPVLHLSGGRVCELQFDFESEDGSPEPAGIRFAGVEAFKCTYFTSCTPEMISAAYDKVVDLGATAWLAEIRSCAGRHGVDTSSLRHVVIFFDDGPLYEFICSTVAPFGSSVG